MHRKNKVFSLTLLLISLPYLASGQPNVPAPTLITQTIDANALVTLAGNIPPEAIPQNDQGPVANSVAMNQLWIQLKHAPEQQAVLDQYAQDLSNPASSSYHKWLTAEQFGQQFGLAQTDIDTVTGWLQSQGFTVDGTLANRMIITFSGTVQQVNNAFHTSIHKLLIDGQPVMSNMSDPKIPAALAPAIAGIVRLNNIMPRAAHTRPQLGRSNGAQGAAQPNYTGGGNTRDVTPQDLATIYNFNPVFQSGYTGKGQTIVVVEDSDVASISDWTQFRKLYGLTRPYLYASFTQVHPASPALACIDPGTSVNDIEANIDTQWASAAAPDAAIVLASCADTEQFGAFIALENLINSAAPPAIVSVSYQESENQLGTAENSFIAALYEQAGVEGVSVFVATGDSGADANTADRAIGIAKLGISANGLGSTPYNVAVGGTDYEDTYLGQLDEYWNSTNTPFGGSAKSYIPEIPWDASCANVLLSTYHGFATPYGASGFCNSTLASQLGLLRIDAAGGAPSAIYAKPSWQQVFGNPSDSVRDLPDLALFAANKPWGHAYTFCYSGVGYQCATGTFYYSGGTSFATPIMAGFQALVNQKTGSRAGNPNPTYYALANSEYGSSGSSGCDASLGVNIGSACLFHDVTIGDIDVLCQGTANCFGDGAPEGVLSLSSTSYQPAYPAHAGWDFATGLGTIDAYNLLTRWPVLRTVSQR